MTDHNRPDYAQLVTEVNALKRAKQDIITAGGNSMILARGSVDGELSNLYRKDVINVNNPGMTNIPSETAVVAYVEDRMSTMTQVVKKTVGKSHDLLTKLVADETQRAKVAEAELKAKIEMINLDGLKTQITDEAARAQQAEEKLKQKIRDERDRATGAETAVKSSLEREISRASEEEGKLYHMITDEVARAKAAEKALGDTQAGFDARIAGVANDVAAEKTRAESAERALDTKYSAKIENLQNIGTQLRNDISAEATRAAGVESTITTKLNAEVERAQTEEKRLEDLILNNDLSDQMKALSEHVKVTEGIVKQQVEDENRRAINAENELRQQILDETTRSTRADDKFTADLAAETDRAKQAEAKLTADLKAEVDRSTARDENLDGKISSEIERASKVESEIYKSIGELSDRTSDIVGTVNAKIASIDKKVDEEAARAQKADDDMWDAINKESTRASAAEATNAANIAGEITRAKGAEEHIEKLLMEETERSKNTDTKLERMIEEETRRAGGVETKLSDELDKERERALYAEGQLGLRIDKLDEVTVKKDVGGPESWVTQDFWIDMAESQTGDQNAKQLTLHKKLLSLATGNTSESTSVYDLALLSGAHHIGEKLNEEIERAKAAEKVVTDKVDAALAAFDEDQVKKSTFKNSDYKVVVEQALHTEPDSYGSQFWIRTVFKDVRDEKLDVTKELHVVSEDITVEKTALDDTDTRLDVEVNKATPAEVDEILTRIFG